jgi:hypothetical protein
MMSEISGSDKSSSSGPKPSSSSTSTFSSANCSRRFKVMRSSASTSRMIGRNSSVSSSFDSVAAASGSTRSSRRGSTCSLILWTDASNPCAFSGSAISAVERWFSRSIASSSGDRFDGIGGMSAGGGVSMDGNCAPPGTPGPVCIGFATPKAGRPAVPGRRPNALIRFVLLSCPVGHVAAAADEPPIRHGE